MQQRHQSATIAGRIGPQVQPLLPAGKPSHTTAHAPRPPYVPPSHQTAASHLHQLRRLGERLDLNDVGLVECRQRVLRRLQSGQHLLQVGLGLVLRWGGVGWAQGVAYL